MFLQSSLTVKPLELDPKLAKVIRVTTFLRIDSLTSEVILPCGSTMAYFPLSYLIMFLKFYYLIILRVQMKN